MDDSHIIFPSKLQSLSQTVKQNSDEIEGKLLYQPSKCIKVKHENVSTEYISDEDDVILLSGPSKTRNEKDEKDNMKKLKVGIKEKSREIHKKVNILKKEANSIKSEKCISILTQPKSPNKCSASTYLKKSNILPGKITKCKSEICNLEIGKIYKKSNNGNNQLNFKSESSKKGSKTNKNAKESTVKDSLKRIIVLRKRVVNYLSLLKEDPLNIKSEHSELGNNLTKNATKDKHLIEATALHEKIPVYNSLIKTEELDIKYELSEPGTNATNITAKCTNSGLSKGAFSLHEEIVNYKSLIKEQLNTKSEIADPGINTTNNTAKGKHSGSSKGAFTLRERIANYKPLMKEELLNIKSEISEPVTNTTNKDDKSWKIQKVNLVQENDYNPSSLLTDLDLINGNKSSVNTSDNLPTEAKYISVNCKLYNSIIVSNNSELDYAVAKNYDAKLIPLLNGDCTLLVYGYRSIFISRYNCVCVNGTTVPCNTIKMPMNICFDGILKSDRTIMTVLVMWIGIKPEFFDSHRLINGSPETVDFMDVEGILCSRLDKKMIIKAHFDKTNFMLKCSDSTKILNSNKIFNKSNYMLKCSKILNSNEIFTIPNNANVNLYIRKINQPNNKPLWGISWMIFHL